jgi:hypothetical protein
MALSKTFSSVAVGIVLAAWSGGARAADVPGQFGEKGSLAVHVATGSPLLSPSRSLPIFGGIAGATPTLGLQTNTYTDREQCNGNNTVCQRDSTSITSLYINPRIHYFVLENLSIGGELLLASFSGETETETLNKVSGASVKETTKLDDAPGAFGLMPLVGYNIALGSKVSLWPQGGIGFRRATWKRFAPDREYAERWWFLNVDVPLMVHIAPHLELGAGPGLTLNLSQSLDVPQNNATVTYSGYSQHTFRWFNAHVVGYF